MLKPRQRKFIEVLQTNGYSVRDAGIKAGYSEMYANKQGKVLLKGALKAQAKEVVSSLEGTEKLDMKEGKKMMHEILGMSREEVLGSLKNIALNQKDYGTALKVLGALAKELGVTIVEEDKPRVVVPVLNIGVKENVVVHDVPTSIDTAEGSSLETLET